MTPEFQPRDLPVWRQELESLDEKIVKLQKFSYQKPPFTEIKEKYEAISDELLKVLSKCAVVPVASGAVCNAMELIKTRPLCAESEVDLGLANVHKYLRRVIDALSAPNT